MAISIHDASIEFLEPNAGVDRHIRFHIQPIPHVKMFIDWERVGSVWHTPEVYHLHAEFDSQPPCPFCKRPLDTGVLSICFALSDREIQETVNALLEHPKVRLHWLVNTNEQDSTAE